MVLNGRGLKIPHNCFKMAVWFLAVSFWPVYFILYFPLTQPPRVAFQASVLCTTLVLCLIKIMPPSFSKTQATGQFKKKKRNENQTTMLSRDSNRAVSFRQMLQTFKYTCLYSYSIFKCFLMYYHAEVHLRVCVQKTKRVHILYNQKRKAI